MPTDDLAAYQPSPLDTSLSDAGLVSAGNDPILASLSPQVLLSRVHSGNIAIKLNNSSAGVNSYGYGVSSMSKYFIVESASVSFSFSLIVQDPDHPLEDQPHFMARIYNQNNEIVSEFCLPSDVNDNRFNHVTYLGNPLLYTGWQCMSLSTDGIPEGQTARIEFVITDCGWGGHWGTVYIDDICTDGDCLPVFGDINLNVSTVVPQCSSVPINVCGTFVVPQNINSNPPVVGTVSSIVLYVKQNGSIVSTLNNPTITGNSFCFSVASSDYVVPPSLVPDGDYEYEAVATFTVGSNVYTDKDDGANDGPDTIFKNCDTPPCPTDLTITADVTAPTQDNRQARDYITASNTVNSGAVAFYHAGTEVLLIDDFSGLSGSTCHLYIQGCTGEYVQRQAQQIQGKVIGKSQIDLVLIDTTSDKSISVYPNPAADELIISSPSFTLKSVKITALDGKVIYAKDVNDSHHKVNVSSFVSGIYIVSVEDSKGSLASYKIVKK